MDKRIKHGLRKHPLYNVYQYIKQRCYNINDKDYKNYGGRGIKVCDRWLESFANFLEDMGERPTGMTIDRIDVNGNYCKENCKWSSLLEQNNNMRSNKYITYNNETLTYAEWSRKLGGNSSLVSYRITIQGWSEEKAVSTPIKRKIV